MQRALELALQGKGKTSPNPMVGAVIAKGRCILAEGYHKKAGTDHAEIVALKKLKKGGAKGATLYVTMEPCSLYGRTPPCVPAIVKAGIKKVVVGARDPNPKVNGRGIRWLKKSGLQVTEGLLREECASINKPFAKFITSQIPYVTLKVALSLDGKIATAERKSKWISNALSRRYVHQLRSEADAILIGGGTLRADDPSLTVRHGLSKNANQPMVVVVDSHLKPPSKARIFKAKNRPVIFATGSNGRVNLKSLLKKLAGKNVMHLLVEGGGSIFSSFIRGGLADKIVVCLAPKLLGGQALDWLPELSIRKLKEAYELANIQVRTLGDNVIIEGDLSK